MQPRLRHLRVVRKREGLTLLEVILALVVLGISLAAIGEMVRIGVIGASIAKDETKAQMLCETKMNEIVLGMVPAQPIGPVAFDYDPDWVYTVSIIPIEQQELVSCTVFVEQVAVQGVRTQSFELTRWIAEPVVEEETEEAETLLNSGGSSSTGGTSSNNAGTSTGGGNTGGAAAPPTGGGAGRGGGGTAPVGRGGDAPSGGGGGRGEGGPGGGASLENLPIGGGIPRGGGR